VFVVVVELVLTDDVEISSGGVAVVFVVVVVVVDVLVAGLV